MKESTKNLVFGPAGSLTFQVICGILSGILGGGLKYILSGILSALPTKAKILC
jgi:hypothetical protein